MNVLIVESAAKSRTLQKYLGEDWRVVATGGHVQTLPNDRAISGKDAKKAYWSNREGELPAPPWVWTERGEGAVKGILEAGGDEPVFWIATDPDREGEFIAWCLDGLLAPHGPTRRVTFQEVTKRAVAEAIEHPRGVDRRMVDSALVRKFLDRMVGFRASKTSSSFVGKGASMGRVQTPTLGFVVDRELEREAFVPTEYFEVRATALGQDLAVRFHSRGDPDEWRDREGRTNTHRTFDRVLAEAAHDALESAGRVTITRVKEGKPTSRAPSPPFSTDALLQEAGSRLGWSPKKTSALASMLYEAGHITYIRTDSTRLAAEAVEAARAIVRADVGDEYLGAAAGGNVATGPTQDAHEAIRPTALEVTEAPVEDGDARKLYRLVRARTLASQMAASTSASRGIEASCDGLDRPLTGRISWRTFAGWEAVYEEFLAPEPSSPPPLPLEEGRIWTLDEATEERPNPRLIEDETRPRGRYRPHTLIRAMKDAGIGRPSTYSRTVEKLEERKYLVDEEGALVPTDRGRAVWLEAAPLYTKDGEEEAAAELFSTAYTALMEEGLDLIARGEAGASERWEAWRDEIRDLHQAALDRKKAGASTPSQQALLGRLFENAPAGVSPPGTLAELSFREAQDLITRLKEAGVEAAPSKAQRALIERYLEELALGEEERAELFGELAGPPDDPTAGLRTAAQASRIIDDLMTLRDERRPPSGRQRRFIEALMKEAGTTEQEAAAMVGVGGLEELTGGPDGTASALIDALQARKDASSAG
jgi:DNA topoisomerase-1